MKLHMYFWVLQNNNILSGFKLPLLDEMTKFSINDVADFCILNNNITFLTNVNKLFVHDQLGQIIEIKTNGKVKLVDDFLITIDDILYYVHESNNNDQDIDEDSIPNYILIKIK